jgi:hypothetical protein
VAFEGISHPLTLLLHVIKLLLLLLKGCEEAQPSFTALFALNDRKTVKEFVPVCQEKLYWSALVVSLGLLVDVISSEKIIRRVEVTMVRVIAMFS